MSERYGPCIRCKGWGGRLEKCENNVVPHYADQADVQKDETGQIWLRTDCGYCGGSGHEGSWYNALDAGYFH
jgi:hypothetical protein